MRLWARAGKRLMERVGGATVFSLGLARNEVDKQPAVFKRICSQCGSRTDFEWELTAASLDRMLCPKCAVRRQMDFEQVSHNMLRAQRLRVHRDQGRDARDALSDRDASMATAALEDVARAETRVKIPFGDPITGGDW